MTKIKILADRVIFDGHAETREECETITLLCDSLVNNPNFKTVHYENGYAEFEKVGKAEELKFVPAMAFITMVFDSHISAVNSRSPMTVSWTTSGENLETAAIDGTTYIFDVVLASGYVIDTVTLSESDEQLGKLTGKTDTTFSILAGAGGINQTITITSKAATTSGETWVLNETPAQSKIYYYFDSSYNADNPVVSFEAAFVSNNQNFVKITGTSVAPDPGIDETMCIAARTKTDGWTNEAYRTITFATAPTGDLLTWLQANGTKQTSTTTISFRHLYSGGTIGSGAVKFKAYTQTYLPQLATPTNVSVSGTTVSWDAVENAESYDVYVDNTLYENTTGAVTPKGFTVSYVNNGQDSAPAYFKINGGNDTIITEASGTFKNVETIQFSLFKDENYACTIKSTTLGISLSANSVSLSDTYTLTQDVTDIVISWQPAMSR